MLCPKCFGNNVTPVGDTHYICNNPDCVDDHGKRVQFRVVEDEHIRFPANQIFVGRGLQEFYRKPYLTTAAVGQNIT